MTEDPPRQPDDDATRSEAAADDASGADASDDGRMSFGEHLDELRSRLFRALAVIGGIFLVGWTFFEDQLVWLFTRPHRLAVEGARKVNPELDLDPTLQSLNPLEPIFFSLKAALMVSLLIGLPVLIWQIWAFVSVGLYEKERRAVRRFLPWSLLLSLTGLAFCYLIFFPLILEFLYARANTDYFTAGYRVKDYFGLYLMFTVALVVIFQLPLLMMGLGAAGIVDAAFLRKYRRHFILIAFVFGAILTPPEPFSQFLMAVPTVLLYEIGVLLVAVRGSKRRRAASAADEEETS